MGFGLPHQLYKSTSPVSEKTLGEKWGEEEGMFLGPPEGSRGLNIGGMGVGDAPLGLQDGSQELLGEHLGVGD